MSCAGKSSSVLLVSLAILALHSLSDSANAAANSTGAILYDIFPFIRVYKDGRIQRFIGQDFAPATTDPTTGVHSKDVKFDPKLNLSARLYLPGAAAHKLPLLIYFHGGGFFTESAFSPTYHHHLNSLAAKANAVAVSVNYRLAPEHLLPAAYEDSWLALKWAFSHSEGNGPEPWLNTFADFKRVYLGGDSAGATLAHHIAIRVGLENPEPSVNLSGMFLNCPYFLGKRPIGEETSAKYLYGERLMQRLWMYAYPNSSAGLDDPLVNPGMDPDLKMVGCKRVLVYVAGNDVLRFRGWEYKRRLEESGWGGQVKAVEVQGENHVFNLVNSTTPKAIKMLKMLAYFLNH